MKIARGQIITAAALLCLFAFATTAHAQTVEPAPAAQVTTADSTNGKRAGLVSTGSGSDRVSPGPADNLDATRSLPHPVLSRPQLAGKSETEPSVAIVRLNGVKITDSTERPTTAKLHSVTFVSKRSSFSNTAEAPNREAAAQQDPPPDSADASELAKKLSNPVASLISFPIQSNFDFGMGTGSGWRYTLNFQPVLPIKLSPEWNLISRTIIPIIHQSNVTGPNTSQSGLGDIVQSLFFSPNKTEPFIWAVGPVFLLPTATDASLGAQKWGLGPTVLALKQKQGWTYGALANHLWSVAGKSNRADVNATFIQPFLSFSTKDAWTYSLNTESTFDWNSHSWSIPINPFISKLVRFGKQPVSFGGGLKCWVTSPTGGPEGCGMRVVVTALFPKR